MILEVQHETRLEYSEPASEWVAEVRMEPVSDCDQTCQSFHLKLSQPAGIFRYQDGFGNYVHHFNLIAPRQEIGMLAASIVETRARRKSVENSTATWPLDPSSVPLQTLDFFSFRGPVTEPPLLQPLLDALRPQPATRLADLILRVSSYLRSHFRYAPDVTSASSPIDDMLIQGMGVCQDFAHLMIAILRGLHVPARYVSGYIHRPNKESQSHAWCEVWDPDLEWIGIDPTNDCLVDEHFVKVAVGRDFTDVPPNKGVYRSRGEETVRVRVETRKIDRLPSLSWQENLPPLMVPLTTTRARPTPMLDTDEQSQQQQQ
jgi:transglutaminase-like putative cysteine protease